MNRTARASRRPPLPAHRPPGARPWWPACLACLTIAAFLAAGAPARADHTGHAAAPMSARQMQAHADAYWATHQPVGTSSQAPDVATAAATFNVTNFIFEAGGPGQVDTVKIQVGESVLWQWLAGTHTITNGTDSFDPDAGTLFNQPSDVAHQQFMFTFNSTGTYPFFCSFHELQNMRGVVVVSAVNGVEPTPASRTLGFTRDPAPNPTRSGLTFQFAMRQSGRARAEVFDAGGRRVAVLVDQVLPAGSHSASWDGQTPSGIADTGVYFVRLRLPGYDQSRTVVLRR